MAVFHIEPCLAAVTAATVLFLAPVDLSAEEWYWVNDFGGTWDEQFGGVTSWRNPVDNSGVPGEGDDALLVLPYSFSFCSPDGSCFTQPVQVNFRSDTAATLSRLVIESDNLLFQGLLGATTESQLDLASLTEVIGGSGAAFDPPPSYILPPDSPGIYPVGKHAQSAGTNHVRDQLLIGLGPGLDIEGIDPIEGTYELSGSGSLSVGEFGSGLEKIGAGGDGLFVQSGGAHTVDGTLIMAEQGGSSGGYDLSGGSLEVDVEIIGSAGTAEFMHSAGTNTASRVVLGQQVPGHGSYRLSGTGDLDVATATIIGGSGRGSFVHTEGRHTTGRMVLAEDMDSSGSYNLSGSLSTTTLVVEGAETVGAFGAAEFEHDGGSHAVTDELVIGRESSGSGTYFLRSGRLDVSGVTRVGASGEGIFNHINGTHKAHSLVLGQEPGSVGLYTIHGGTLQVLSNLQVSADGEGSLEQSGGEVLIKGGGLPSQLTIGNSQHGFYYLNDGLLEVFGKVVIGRHGVGGFEQNGGRHTVRAAHGSPGQVSVGQLTYGRYTLRGGELETDQLEIGHLSHGVGTFVQFEEVGVSSRVTVSELNVGHAPSPDSVFGYAGAYQLYGGDVTADDARIGIRGIGLFQQSGGRFSVNHEETVGAEYVGRYEQTGGFHIVNGKLVLGAGGDSIGEYILDDGSLEVVGVEVVGRLGTGVFDHSSSLGGYHHRVTGELVIGSQTDGSGTYSLSGPVSTTNLNVEGTETIGSWGEGTFDQDGGTHTVDHELILGRDSGGSGAYFLRSGNLTVESESTSSGVDRIGVRGSGVFEQSGGTHSVDILEIGAGPGGLGTYRLTEGALEAHSERIGIAEGPGSGLTRGSFVQSGGVHSVHSLRIAGLGHGGRMSASGEYALSGGNLETNVVYIGQDGAGQFSQTGGRHVVTRDMVLVGDLPEGDASYSLTDGDLEVHGDEWIGGLWDLDEWDSSLKKRFDQEGPSYHEVRGTLYVGQTGVYQFNDGAMQCNRVVIAGATTTPAPFFDDGPNGTFLQYGGTHVVNVLDIKAGDVYAWGGGYALTGGTLIVDTLHIRSGPSPDYLMNTGRLTISGGTILSVSLASLHNDGLVIINGEGTATIEGTVNNSGRFELDGATVAFEGVFNNDNAFITSDSGSRFDELRVGDDGYLAGGEGDTFIVNGNFLNGSHQEQLWDTDAATLILSGSGPQTVELPGEDRGDSLARHVDNFAWGVLQVLEGAQVEFTDGNPDNDGTAIYVGVLDLPDEALIDPDDLVVLPFSGDATVYYNPDLPENDYLSGLTYVFADGGGILTTYVPEPLLGDVNLDGEVNGLDVGPFIEGLLNGPYQPEADMNEDQVVNGLDVDPFVAAVVGGSAQEIPEPSTLLLALVALGLVGGSWKYERRGAWPCGAHRGLA